MIEARLVLENETGLHARPAAMLVKCAARFRCQISITAGSKKANAKSIMAVLSLGAVKGDELIITAEGPDEKECMEEIRSLVAADFNGA